MTLMQAVSMADELKPNAFSPTLKVGWLNDCEGLVQTEVFLLEPEACLRYDGERDMDAQLLAVPPFDKLYWTYLAAMIDFALGEYSSYQNTMQLFNTYFGEYQRWYARRFHPADGGGGSEFFAMVRGTTPVLEFGDLPVQGEEITQCAVTFSRGGSTPVRYDLEDMTCEGTTLTCPISHEDSLKLDSGLYEVRVTVRAGEQWYETMPLMRVMVYETGGDL